jgi:hypothetical protein
MPDLFDGKWKTRFASIPTEKLTRLKEKWGDKEFSDDNLREMLLDLVRIGNFTDTELKEMLDDFDRQFENDRKAKQDVFHAKVKL